jgi:hypothetical protein
MKNKLWSFGCSFTAEYHPLNETPPNNYDRYREFKGGELPPVWPTILSERLGLENSNKGVGASSNYHIFYQFCKFCSELKEDDVVIVGWTSPYRFILASKEYNFLQSILPKVEYRPEEYDQSVIDYILVNRDNPIWNEEIISFTRIIDEVCKEKKCKVFYWSFHLDVIEYIQAKYENYSEDKYILGHDGEELDKTLRYGIERTATIQKETKNLINDLHFGEYGHQKQANYFYNHIKPKIKFK